MDCLFISCAAMYANYGTIPSITRLISSGSSRVKDEPISNIHQGTGRREWKEHTVVPENERVAHQKGRLGDTV